MPPHTFHGSSSLFGLRLCLELLVLGLAEKFCLFQRVHIVVGERLERFCGNLVKSPC